APVGPAHRLERTVQLKRGADHPEEPPMSRTTLIALLSLGTLVAGCGAPEVDAADPAQDGERQAESCVPLGPSVTLPLVYGQGNIIYAESPGTSYGCNNRFTLNLTGSQGKSFLPWAEWVDEPPAGDFGCSLANIYIEVYGYSSGAWHLLGSD